MDEITQILTAVQPYRGNSISIRKRQTIKDLMGDILHKHEKNEQAANAIARKFWRGTTRDTAKYLFDYYKGRIKYDEEDTDNQTVKSLAAIHVEGVGDCKHFSQAIVSICCALRRMGYPIKAKYRFAVYNSNPNAQGVRSGHVFAVIMDQGREIWCDPVLMSFDQRYPKYISHQDKTPPMGEPIGKIGQVWDVSGVPNGDMISGMENGETLGWLDHLSRGKKHRFAVPLHLPHMHHGHHHNKFDLFLDSPLNPMHPGIPMPGLHDRISGYSADADDYGTTYTMSGYGLGWVDENLGRRHRAPKAHGHGHKRHHVAPVYTEAVETEEYQQEPESEGDGMGWADESLGKKHRAKKHHKPHKKLQLGKFLKKYNVGLVSLRNAFLLYIKMNLFHTGSKIYAKIYKDPAAKKTLYEWWEKQGGNSNKLSTALTQAMHVWNKHHKAHKIAGFDEAMSGGHLMLEDTETMGVAQVAIPAVIAAAMPFVLIICKKLGLKGPSKEEQSQAEEQAAKDHNEATDETGDGKKDVKGDGSVDHGDGVTTKVDVDPKTGKQTITYDVKDPTEDGGTDGVQTKTKIKTTTKSDTTDEQGDEVETITKEKSVTKVTPPGAHNGIAAFWDNSKNFVLNHKAPVALATVGTIGLIFSIAHKFPKKSSAPVLIGIGSAVALVAGGIGLFKKQD